MQHSKFAIASGIAVGGVLAYLAYRHLRKQRNNWKKIGVITNVFIHPIKSCDGIEISSATCTQHGLYYNTSNIMDRGFLVTQPDGTGLTANGYPCMVKISIEVQDNGGSLILNAPGMDAIKFKVPVPSKEARALVCRVFGEEVPGIDCGDEVATWLQKYISVPDIRLQYHPNTASVRPLCQRDRYALLRPHNQNNGNPIYHNFAPYNMLSEESLHDVIERLDKNDNFSVKNFRPNFLISGCSPYEENLWTRYKIGSAEFKFAKHCQRGLKTTIDMDTGIMRKNEEPLTTLRTFRLCKPEEKEIYGTSPILGVDLGITKTGSVSVGDVVYAC
uniref:MOSC domain-containing protein n=1 Tax=Ciona savignyi TaxID=51511 RepID=H2YY36_CIOSA